MRNLVSLSLVCCALAAPQTKKIVVTGLNAEEVRQLQSAAPEARVVAASGPQVRTEIADADAVVTGGLRPDDFRAARKLAWVQILSAGAEGILFPELRDSQLTLTNCKIIQGPEIADHAMALLLSLTRSLYQTIPDKSGQWTRGQHHPIELRNKTAVIVGTGGIGMQIAQRAFAFGMRVIGVDPKDISYTYFLTKVVTPDRLDEVLPEADVVFVSAPLTRDSERMMGPRQFSLMKTGAYFIAVSRGKLYDTDALVQALDSKRLAGAGLDVTNPEPLPPNHPLWKFPNAVITPHIAGTSDGVQARRIELIQENVRRFVAGKPLLNVVDKRKGY